MNKAEQDRLSIKRDGLLKKKRLLDAIKKLIETAPKDKKLFYTDCYYLTNAINTDSWYPFNDLMEAIKFEGAMEYSITKSTGSPWGESIVTIIITDKFDEIHKKIGEEYHAVNDILIGSRDKISSKTTATLTKKNLPVVKNIYINKPQIHSGVGNNINKEKVTTNKNIDKTMWWKIIPIAIAFISIPWWPTLLGSFKKNNINIPNKAGEIKIFTAENSIDPNSKNLDRSIFDLAKETVETGLTSQERVNLISNISGLETKEESGKILDIGAGGLTLLISGSGDNEFSHVKCDFSLSWKQRIFLLKKDQEIKFIGTVSKYDLSMQWIILKDCKLSE